MPKCNACGHTESFVYEIVESSKVWFNPDGDVVDSKSLEVTQETLVACGECFSEDVEADFRDCDECCDPTTNGVNAFGYRWCDYCVAPCSRCEEPEALCECDCEYLEDNET